MMFCEKLINASRSYRVHHVTQSKLFQHLTSVRQNEKVSAMSAFAARGKKQDVKDYCYPYPLEELLVGPVKKSNFTFTIHNSIYTPTSIVLGLLPSQYLVVNGLYSLKVFRGTCLINNVHKVPNGKEYPIITSSVESLPTICVAPESESSSEVDPDTAPVLPEFTTLIELSNLDTGIENIGTYYPALKKLYKNHEFEYSFDIVENEADASSTIFFTQQAMRALNGMCRQMEAVAVFGVPNSGKRTIARTLLNNMLLSGKEAVAYLDLDPSSVDSDTPGCLTLRIIRKPIFGQFFFWFQDESGEEHSREKHIHRYYGHESFSEQPQQYMRLCLELLEQYHKNFREKGIPIVVKYPPWMKGYGKELLIEFSRALNPKKMAYLTHNDALCLENFEPDAFEKDDHPDLDIISGLQCKDHTIIRGVRRARAFTKTELLFRNKLLYFHQPDAQHFNFIDPILQIAPVELPFEHVAAVSVVHFNTNRDLSNDDAFTLVEATIMGIFATEPFSQKSERFFMNGSKFEQLKSSFLGLCMVHSVSVDTEAFVVYLRDEDRLTQQMLEAKQDGKVFVLARGQGQIPDIEFTKGLNGSYAEVPYVNFGPQQKLGGVWKVRKNIGRKNQG